MYNYKQDPPNCIQIELTEGCNLACSFCGLQGIRNNKANGPRGIRGTNSKPYKFLTMHDAEIIAKRIATTRWNPRLEFALHGEPTLNPSRVEILKIFRKFLPKLSFMMSSNGGGLLRGDIASNINELFDAGLNILLLEDYDGVNIVKKILAIYDGPYKVCFYPKQKKANPHHRCGVNNHFIVVVRDISIETRGTHSYLCGHGGAAFPPNDTMLGKRCAKPFREISIRYNGNIAICCDDFRGQYKCGSVIRTPLEKIWHNKFFNAARVKLYYGERDFGPCHMCDSRSFRLGLLPDRMGKKTMPQPNALTYRTIIKALSGRSYAEPVKRPWENSTRPRFRRYPV